MKWGYRVNDNQLAMIAVRLKSIRTFLRITQAKFAESLGVSHRSYHHYEAGTRQAPVDVLYTAAQLSDRDFLWLITGQPEIHIDAYDIAILATIELLEKEGLHLSNKKMLVIARQAFELSAAKRTPLEDELPKLIHNVKDLIAS